MRSRIAVLVSLLAAGILGASAAQAAKVNIGSASGAPGDTVTFDATLSSEGTDVAGLQVDIAFDASARIAARANGRPNCTVNPEINKPASSAAFRPPGCTGDACNAVRIIVLSTEDVDVIPDGSTLFTCTVAISAEATAGAKALTGSNAIFSTPAGGRVDGSTTAGAITVTGGTEPTPTATTPPMACPEPRPAPAGPGVYVRDLTLDAGATTGQIQVYLASAGQQFAGLQNDLAFAENIRVAARANGRPDCTVNPEINKPASSAAFRPPGCTGNACNAVRVIVLSTEDVDPIPDGSLLYTCNVTISASTNATLVLSNVILSTPAGGRVDGTGNQDGEVCFSGGEEPTPTPTTGEPVACATPRPAPAGPAVWLQDQVLESGSTSGTVRAYLAAAGQQFAGLQNDFTFEGGVRVAARANGRPDCTINPEINKPASSFAFRPPGCSGAACTGVRGIVLSTEDVDPIADGALLYTCNITVEGSGTFVVSNVILSTPAGGRVNGSGQDGIVCVEGDVPPTATPTEPVPPTATPTQVPPPPSATATSRPATATATATAQASPTSGQVTGRVGGGGAAAGATLLPLVSVAGFPSQGVITIAGVPGTIEYTGISGNNLILATGLPSAASAGALVTLVSGPSQLEDEGGCHIGASTTTANGWLLLLPLAALLVIRRRVR